MATLETVKRALRENPYSRRPYHVLAREWASLHAGVFERLFGRFHTAERFDRIFSQATDPWGYAGDSVSEERRQLILEILPRNSYSRLLEVGCAEGWVTQSLADRAEELVAVDISQVALTRARERCRGRSNIRFVQLDLLTDPLPQGCEGIVCAGVLVYVRAGVQEKVRNAVVASLKPGGDLLLEHTRDAHPGEVAGDAVHALYRQHPGLTVRRHQEVEGYAITLFEKVG